jgi:hypothetical protein
MQHKKVATEAVKATRASVEKEMAKPRMAKSARIAERNLDTAIEELFDANGADRTGHMGYTFSLF